MRFVTAGRLAIVGVMTAVPMAAAEAQEPGSDEANAGFDDPVFRQLVDAGPETSEELELVVTVYAANGMTGEATNAFVEYLSRSDPAADPFCGYCGSLLSTVRPHEEQSTLARALRDAIEIVGDDAAEAGSSDGLIRLAAMTGVSDYGEHQDLALYLLVTAAQFGIDDAWRDDVVHLLARVGLYAEALTIAQSLYEDSRSAHYQSADLENWVVYLGRMVERNRVVGSIIAAAATN